MSEIPADILEAADRATLECYEPKTQIWYDVRDVIARAILADRQRDQWQDISTARHGVLHLLYEPHHEGGFIFVGACNGVWFNNLDQRIQHPTHWMFLPSAPKGTPT